MGEASRSYKVQNEERKGGKRSKFPLVKNVVVTTPSEKSRELFRFSLTQPSLKVMSLEDNA